MATIRFITFLLLVAVLSWACAAPAITPRPPLIEAAGKVSSVNVSNDTIDYVFTDGRHFNFSTNDRRLLTPTAGGEMAILGVDATGPFAAAYTTQGGLPADCYVDNSAGVDRGPYIELRGVLWQKAPTFEPAQEVGLNGTYPRATRFCFNEPGQMTRTFAG
jgi:hypothetical protein